MHLLCTLLGQKAPSEVHRRCIDGEGMMWGGGVVVWHNYLFFNAL